MNFIAKQPNGLYCKFSTVFDCPVDWNMTKEDVVRSFITDALFQARTTLYDDTISFNMVLESFVPNILTEEEFEKIVKEMSEPVKED